MSSNLSFTKMEDIERAVQFALDRLGVEALKDKQEDYLQICLRSRLLLSYQRGMEKRFVTFCSPLSSTIFSSELLDHL